jgi:hypothetical protein
VTASETKRRAEPAAQRARRDYFKELKSAYGAAVATRPAATIERNGDDISDLQVVDAGTSADRFHKRSPIKTAARLPAVFYLPLQKPAALI